MNTEILVIGGGIAGCSTAYFLAKAGHKVTLLEKNPGVGLEASGRNACGVRQQGRKAALPLSLLSVREIWTHLEEELDCDVEYRQVGNLKLRLTEADVKLLEEEVAWEHAHGLPEVRMVTGDECREMVPGLSNKILAGKYCPTDGIANPMLVTPAIARGAKRLGAKILTNTPVTGLLIGSSKVYGVTTGNGKVEADVVVNAAGPWASKFNEMAGCQTPIQPGMSQLMITERLPHVVTTWTSPGYAYFLQVKSGNLAIGISGKPNFNYRKAVDYPDIVQKAGQIIDLLPSLANTKFLRAFSGITEYTPDKQPYIGAVPGISGFYTVCGFHGEGFCVGPAAGKVTAELVCGLEPSVPLDAFNPGRFRTVDEVAVYHNQAQISPGTSY